MSKKLKKKIKIGVVGEHPEHDSKAFIALLQQVASKDIEFQVLTKNFNGSDLDNPRFLSVLKNEFEEEQLNKNPMAIGDPKKLLQKYTDKAQKGKYAERHAPDIFKQLNFKTVYKNHCGERSFQAFADELKELKIIDFD